MNELEAALRHLHAEMDSAKQTERPESEDVRTAIWSVRQAIAVKRKRLATTAQTAPDETPQ